MKVVVSLIFFWAKTTLYNLPCKYPTLGIFRGETTRPKPSRKWIVGVVGFEPTQPKHQIYSLAQLSNVGALP